MNDSGSVEFWQWVPNCAARCPAFRSSISGWAIIVLGLPPHGVYSFGLAWSPR